MSYMNENNLTDGGKAGSEIKITVLIFFPLILKDDGTSLSNLLKIERPNEISHPLNLIMDYSCGI